MNIAKRKYSLKCKNPDEYDNCEPYEVVLRKGRYIFECMGASGEAEYYIYKGHGARVKGVITLKEEKTFYIYVGGSGNKGSLGSVPYGGYNGGGDGGIGFYDSANKKQYQSGFGGGGATDIRTVKGSWNDHLSLNSRIIVAAGGGGGTFTSLRIQGGDGGTLEGFSSFDAKGNVILGGNQTNGFAKGEGDSADKKEVSGSYGAEGNSGAGGGWYGGFTSHLTGDKSISAAGGGSSFISGHEGLEIINNLKFDMTHMEGGDVTNYIGDGYAIITHIFSCTRNCRYNHLSFAFFPLTLLLSL